VQFDYSMSIDSKLILPTSCEKSKGGVVGNVTSGVGEGERVIE
jgi:hypothetical protein